MKRLISRLRGKRGEMLIETLMAILIFTLSSIILLSMVAGAVSMNRAAKAADADRAEQLNAAYNARSADKTGVISINYHNSSAYVYGGDADVDHVIAFHQRGDGDLYSFDYASNP